jgi:diaminopimelate epimerase
MACKQRIVLPGGELVIEVLPDNVMMTGGATLVFEGTI